MMPDLTNLSRDQVVEALQRAGYTDDEGIKSVMFTRTYDSNDNGRVAVYVITFLGDEGKEEEGMVYIMIDANNDIVGEY